MSPLHPTTLSLLTMEATAPLALVQMARTVTPPSVEMQGMGAIRSRSRRGLACLDPERPRKKQRRVPKKKRVSFGIAFTVRVPRVESPDKPLVWWNDEELRQGLCDDLGSSCQSKNYQQQLLLPLAISMGKMPASDRVCLALAEHPLRGLERIALPCFRERKKRVAANVLHCQATLEEASSVDIQKEKDIKQHGANQLLANHYSKLALPTAIFAQLLARGDELVVTRMNACSNEGFF